MSEPSDDDTAEWGSRLRFLRVFVRACSTPQYQAPELLAENVATVGYTKAVDWWAFGCMVVSGRDIMLTLAVMVSLLFLCSV